MSDENTQETPEAEAEQPRVPAPTAAQVPAPEAPSLNINDLKTMLQIIAVVSSRGAVKPEEMAPVGSLYTKLHAFLTSVGALNAPDAAPDAAPADDGETS